MAPPHAEGFRWRRHQRLALDALAARHAAAARDGTPSRAWVVLPPGAGKTRVGLEVAREALRSGAVRRAVVLTPNTAIQAQWTASAREVGLDASASRALDHEVSVLTYQSVAVFARPGGGDAADEPDEPADVDGSDEPDEPTEVDDDAEHPLITRLHANGRALVERLRAAGPLLLVLDECHHLLELWGELLVALLDEIGEARVVGLTATPPETLRADQAATVRSLFGGVAFAAGVPAVVREGDLAPFAELAWFVEPTASERQWLAEGATRFAELTALLSDPGFGSTSFPVWLRERFGDADWASRALAEPEHADAVLRLAHAGVLPVPAAARLREEHRQRPTGDDWMLLLDLWLRRCLRPDADARDAEVVEVVRRTLPAVGRVWTRNGIRRGRDVVDRVLARSEAKADACVEIVGHELGVLGDRLRMLVLCDHERATATLPMTLQGVVDAGAGSAWALLERLCDDAATGALDPLLVTGASVAARPATLEALRAHVAAADPGLASTLRVEPAEERAGLARLVGGTGAWRSRRWVPLVTRFFEDGGTRVLVGTKGLLGEGWDARRVSGLVDLTSATTSTAVVQTRGRSLRVDPAWPEKVAVNWTLTCVAPEHPRGDGDWRRLVRKHEGYFGVDDAGDVVDGVGHLDPALSAFAPPEVEALAAINARAVLRAADRDAIARRWRVGEPYDDRAGATLRLRARSVERLPALMPATRPGHPHRAERVPAPEPDAVLLIDEVARGRRLVARAAGAGALLGLVLGFLLGALLGAALAVAGTGAALLAGAGGAAALARHRGERDERDERRRGHALAAWHDARRPVALAEVAGAVADALHEVGDTPRGAEAVELRVDDEGVVRCRLTGVDEPASRLFAEALEEAVGPLLRPRYVVERPLAIVEPSRDPDLLLEGWRAGPAREGSTWHAVPAVLGVNAARARVYARAWSRWALPCDAAPARALFTGSPEGAGVLAAQHGADPLDVSAVVRRHWS